MHHDARVKKMSFDAICPHGDRMTPFLVCLSDETAEKKPGGVAFLVEGDRTTKGIQ